MKFFYIILLLLLISLQETSQVKLRSKLLMKLKAKSKHKAYENLVKNVYKEDNTPYPIFELGQQDIPPELQQLTKYFNQPYLEKNIDDLNLHSKDVSETINRLIYFPSDKFVLKPQRLQEMDERLRLKWNIPSPKDYILSNRTNKYFPIKRFKNEQQKMYYLQANGLGNSESKADKTYRMLQNYRFSQISSENREQLKENVIKNEQFSVDIVNCWASSRFDVQFQQWYTNWFHFNGRLQSSRQQTKWHEWYGYPCKTSHLPYNHETKMWISQELNSKNLMEPIEFRGEFSQVRRIILFIVNWWIAPEELEILISTDLENWEKVKQWTKITEINNDDNYIGTQTSFSQVIDLGEGSKDRWFRGFKFHMRKPMQTNRMGFYNLEAISAQFTVMFRNNNHQNLCISKADSDFFSNGANLNVQNCVDVISMGDAREVFVIDDSFQIQSLIDEYCITTKNGIAKDENPLVLIPCSDAISLSDKREQFVVVARGKHFQMVFLDDQDFCISTFDHGKLDNALREDVITQLKF